MEIVTSPEAAAPKGPYSPALKFGNWVVVSGQAAVSPEGEFLYGTIEEETATTLNNIRVLLEAAGARVDQVVKCNCYLADLADFQSFNGVYSAFFGDHKPCRTTVEAGLPKIKVEIDAMAWVGE